MTISGKYRLKRRSYDILKKWINFVVASNI